MVQPLKQWSPQALNTLNWVIIVGSVTLCSLALPLRLPGMELAGTAPNWLLIWVVTWSVKRPGFSGVLAGICLGLIQDGLTASHPTHVIGLALAGLITGRLNKQRYIAEDFISVALIVFGMAVFVTTVMAIQLSIAGDRPLMEIWSHHQRIALSSAILSSLWTPVVYLPLNQWWQRFSLLTQQE